jgi:hypothetical protein
MEYEFSESSVRYSLQGVPIICSFMIKQATGYVRCADLL